MEVVKVTRQKMELEDFVKTRVKDRQAMLRASAAIDVFRKKYGKPDKGFDSVIIGNG